MIDHGKYHVIIFLAQPHLLPCPFCGQTSVKVDWHPAFYAPNLESHYCECMVCGGRGPEAYDPLSAVRAWNERERS